MLYSITGSKQMVSYHSAKQLTGHITNTGKTIMTLLTSQVGIHPTQLTFPAATLHLWETYFPSYTGLNSYQDCGTGGGGDPFS